MKIVLDTNVLVSGLLNADGNPARVVSLALSGALQICYDSVIVAEYTEVLGRPRFKFDPSRVAEILEKLTNDGIQSIHRHTHLSICQTPTTSHFWPLPWHLRVIFL